MRIISGQAKGRRLVGPKGLSIRPTADKVREALFGILGERIAGANFLDLYAGSGSVAIEALSRGAASAVMVEQNPRAIQLIRGNLTRCGLSERARIIPSSVSQALPRLAAAGIGFDIIFIDPPYESQLIPETLIGLAKHDMLQPHSLVIVEHRYRNKLFPQVDKLERYRENKYGQTGLSFYQLI